MRGRIRAALSALLCLALCLGTARAAEGRDLTEQEALASSRAWASSWGWGRGRTAPPTSPWTAPSPGRRR